MRNPASNPPRPAATRPGFTLIELIVAVSVTSVLLLLVSRVFNETTKAINIGADTSQIVSNARVLSDQMFQDLARINKPKANPEKLFGGISNLAEPAGFMVLIQQTNSGLRFPLPDVPRQDPENWQTFRDLNRDGTQQLADGETDWPAIRTDQLAFFTPADRAESLAPGSQARYDTDAVARMQRIWYGHVARANLDGSIPDNTEPGQAPASGDDDFDFTRITDLVLGRQGLLILDDQSLWPNGNRVYDVNTGSVNSDAQALTAIGGDVSANQFRLDDRVDELPVRNASGNYDQLWKGATDTVFLRDDLNANLNFSSFFELRYDNIARADGLYAIGVNRPGTIGAVVPDLRDPPRPGGLALDANELPTEFYNRHALGWTFASPGQRLITTQDLDYPYQPETLGRNHNFFIPYVSDFAVDFAADITDDYALADDPDTFDDQNGNGVQDAGEPDILDNVLLPWWDERWATWRAAQAFTSAGAEPTYRQAAGFFPDGLPDGRPDEYVIDPEGAKIVGVKWYTMSFDPSETGSVFGNPVIVAPGVAQGNAINRSMPAFYRLPMNVDNQPSSSFNFPFQQVDGLYHSIPAPTGTTTATGTIDYPPYVGLDNPNVANFTGGIPVPNILAADTSDYSAGGEPSIDSRAVFVFGHTTDFDLNGPTAGPLPGDGTNTAGTANQTARNIGADGFESGSAKWWPYALRIRYRLHDGDATYNSVGEIPSNAAGDEFEPIPGKWFEQIVPVPHHGTHRPELPQ
ncbi:MAG: prepilin-type N-terminal cleavage/methylation domain-containing protein [Planctomycetota bacterium]